MDVSKIVAEIDAKIASLQQARAVLVGLNLTDGIVATEPKRRGRPKGSKNGTKIVKPAKKKKRNLSPEGRKAIADAMKRRWAERRKPESK